MNAARHRARALIVRNDHVLVIKKRGRRGKRLSLPGGRPKAGETLYETLRRECMEEIGANVEVAGLFYVAQSANEASRPPKSDWEGRIEWICSCTIDESYEAAMGPRPDANQVGVEWLPVDEVSTRLGYPDRLCELLREGGLLVPLAQAV